MEQNPWIENKPVAETPTEKKDGMSRIADAAEAYIKQQRWSRRWTNILKMVVILYVLGSLFMFAGFMNQKDSSEGGNEHIAVIKIDGQIAAGAKVSAERINPLLKQAFENPKAKAVLLDVNSPGGSPVQSALINDEILRLKALYNKPVYAVAQDMCASGCYYIVAAADEIYVNKGSLIGSIGVRFDSFGFTDLMDKIGVENRSMSAGDHKNFANPFGQEDEEAKAFFQERILDRTHQQFIEVVRQGRGERLQETKDMFSGLVWLGDEAVELGLVDGLGDIGFVSRELIGINRLRAYEQEKNLMEQLMGDLVAETSMRLSQALVGMR